MKVEKLEQVAREFRAALEALSPRPRQYAALKNFPKGCCKDASFLFARYLDLHHGAKGMRYVYGTRDIDTLDWYTHGWLEVGDVVVDLTADQFEEVKEPVIVASLTESEFHRSWPRRSPSSYPGIWHFHERAGPDFEATLNDICQHLGVSERG